MRKLLFSGWLRRSAETSAVMGDLVPQLRGYAGNHRDERPAKWTPAHTPAAARRRAQLAHVRPDGERPDLRIEKTVALDIDRIQSILAGGEK